MPSAMRPRIRRRAFLAGAASMVVTGWGRAPALVRGDAGRPAIPWGVQSGDAGRGRAVVWSATDRPARMMVEYATSDRFVDARRAVPVAALPGTGLAAKVVLTGLPAGQDIFYRVTFQDLRDLAATSAPVTGRFRSAPADGRDVSFAWSAVISLAVIRMRFMYRPGSSRLR